MAPLRMITYRHDPGIGALLFVASGPLELQEYRALMAELLRVDYDRLATNFVWDLRGIDPSSISTSDIIAVAEMSRPVLRSHGTNWVSALVVQNDLQFGLARMVESFIGVQGDSEIRVFKDLDQGVEWVATCRRRSWQPSVL